MNKLNIEILNSLADDYESINTIRVNKGVDKIELIKILKEMYEKEYVIIMNNLEFDETKILNKPTAYWFGLSEKGANKWEQINNQDWYNMWAIELNYNKMCGKIYCQNKDTIIKQYDKLIVEKPEYSFTKGQLIKVNKYKFKYYKTLDNVWELNIIIQKKIAA